MGAVFSLTTGRGGSLMELLQVHVPPALIFPSVSHSRRTRELPLRNPAAIQKEKSMPEDMVQTGLSDNSAGGLAYVTIIPAIIFLIVPPYNRSSYVRFHAWQSIFLTIAYIVVDVGLHIFLRFIPFMGLAGLVIFPLFSLAMFILWVFVLLKAFNGQRIKLPLVGDLAEKQANS
jgi:uncharacterized membrane protein